MPETHSPAEDLKLLGGDVSLDFANTVDWHASDHPREYLTRYADLVAWSEHAGLLSKRTAQLLLREADQRRPEADAILRRALDLREGLYRMFVAIAQGKSAASGDVTQMNLELGRALPKLQVTQAENGFTWQWQKSQAALDQMLWPITRSAAELLTSEHLDRVRQCADATDGCGWLFLDMSKNRTRRWCDMKDCGNRAKVRRYRNVPGLGNAIGKDRRRAMG